MARQRDYRAEYARRQAKARQDGWQSYWHQRQTQQEAKQYQGASRRAFIGASKDPPADLAPADVRRLWAEGDEAMRDGDRERARQIAEQLDLIPEKDEYPPESAFWYH